MILIARPTCLLAVEVPQNQIDSSGSPAVAAARVSSSIAPRSGSSPGNSAEHVWAIRGRAGDQSH